MMQRQLAAASKLLIAIAMCSLGQACLSQQSESKGPIREWLKERWISQQQSKPAPESSTDTSLKITKPGDYTYSVPIGGLTRMYRVHVPAKYDPAVPTPLLLSFHGGGADMEYQSTDKYYGQVAKSESDGFIVVFPNGFSKLKSGKFATWNAGTCCAGARDEKVDDVAFVRKIVENLRHQLNVDNNRVYASGMSNGGMLTYRLACEMSDTFKAIASVAGTDNTVTCTPQFPVSVLHIHAKNDDHVLFTGGAGQTFRDKSMVTNFTSAPATIAKWVKLDACNQSPNRILDKPGAYCDAYSQCKDGVTVELCVTETGGHSWPGAEKTRGEPSSKAISANDIMWEFFNRR
jgi:polyhydroxybutyrate depolymerase